MIGTMSYNVATALPLKKNSHVKLYASHKACLSCTSWPRVGENITTVARTGLQKGSAVFKSGEV